MGIRKRLWKWCPKPKKPVATNPTRLATPLYVSVLISGLLLTAAVALVLLPPLSITPTDTRIVDILYKNKETLLSIDGVVGAGIARDKNNYIMGIAVYVEDNMTDIHKVPSMLGEFKVFVKRMSEASEFEKERMIIYRVRMNK